MRLATDCDTIVPIAGANFRVGAVPYGVRQRIEAVRLEARAALDPVRERVKAAHPDADGEALGRLLLAEPEFAAAWPRLRGIDAACDLELVRWSLRSVDGVDVAGEREDDGFGTSRPVVPRAVLDRLSLSPSLLAPVIEAVKAANTIGEADVLGFLRASGSGGRP